MNPFLYIFERKSLMETLGSVSLSLLPHRGDTKISSSRIQSFVLETLQQSVSGIEMKIIKKMVSNTIFWLPITNDATAQMSITLV